MRIIKFRVWDQDEERFIEWFNPDPMLSCKDGELWCYERRGYDENGNFIQGDDLTHTSISKRNLTLHQFTGLKDKNGKEIYAGDIVSLTFKTLDLVKNCYEQSKHTILPIILENIKDNVYTGQVKYDEPDEGTYALLSQFTYFVGLICFANLKRLVAQSDIEVVGNIFENPELVK